MNDPYDLLIGVIICVCRNSESTGSMKGAQSNGVGQDKKVVVGNSPSRATTNSNRNNNCNNNNNEAAVGGGGSSEKGGSSSGSEPAAVIWPPKFVLGLTNKEKEEDFLAIKGSKLPHRPKKRAKFIQRTLNVSLLFPQHFFNKPLCNFLCNTTLVYIRLKLVKEIDDQKNMSNKLHQNYRAAIFCAIFFVFNIL